jgi:hypothetical protein
MGIEMNEEGYGEGYRIDAEQDGRPLRFDSKGGGLLKDTLDDASDEPEDRTALLRDWLNERADMLEPGQTPPLPLEAGGDEDGEKDEEGLDEDWPEDR